MCEGLEQIDDGRMLAWRMKCLSWVGRKQDRGYGVLLYLAGSRSLGLKPVCGGEVRAVPA